MATWPADFPQKPDAGQWTGGRENNKVTFQPEIGPSIDRRRGTAAGSRFQATFSFVTDAQRAIFETWYIDTLFDGVLPFEWADPVSDAVDDWKFDGDAPQFAAQAAGYNTLTCSLYRLP